MWSLIVAIVVGFFAGLIARALHPGNDKAGFIVTTALGIAGSLLATYGGRLLGLYGDNSAAGFIASVIGAVIILFIYNLIMGGVSKSMLKQSRLNFDKIEKCE
ncbi:GlsB/YeaQ/YmgE family stress response membrane protein [Acinetobacter junii]|uniref:GlsB/YeaQ/YmgE family stress response membrane protein n=1 Tax=Acinetobacter junii TaxID=40215 RepID=UPI001D18DBC6|nr:GlsB/YeaQ/YmgE family stress response membrane protein [Acinetobacter junii]